MDVRDNAEAKRFEIDLGDGVAFAAYELRHDEIVFIHTEVPPGHEGEGVGKALVKAGLESARARGLKVLPLCPFFAAYIKRHPEEQDLLSPRGRAHLGLH